MMNKKINQILKQYKYKHIKASEAKLELKMIQIQLYSRMQKSRLTGVKKLIEKIKKWLLNFKINYLIKIL